MPRIWPSTTEAIDKAAVLLRQGRIVAFPTETVYGLGADVFSEAALAAIFALKERPLDNPLIAHVLDETQATQLVSNWDDRCSTLARRFWPGPLTIVRPKAAAVPDAATAGLETVAVRCPAHTDARRLLEAFGGAIAAPSANRSGHISPTTAGHVADEFASCDDLFILDGGACECGIESTVLQVSDEGTRILRPGSITEAELIDAIGEVQSSEVRGQGASPGTTAVHYAPRTAAELIDASALALRLEESTDPVAVLGFDGTCVPPPHRMFLMPRSPQAYAHELYCVLREADASGMTRILIESPGSGDGLWAAVLDRLRRATQAEASA